jgi:glycosyltransferase involved in cell wall biosynthesis
MPKVALLYDAVLDIGGVESHVLSILGNRDSNRFTYILFSEVSERFSDKINALGVEIVRLERRHPLNPITSVWLAQVFKKKQVDIIHAHSPTAALWGRFAARNAGIPAVVTVHLPVDQYHGGRNSLRARSGRRLYIALDRWLNHCPSYTCKLIYVSQDVYQQQIASGQSPSETAVVIPNGIDLRPFRDIDRGDARLHFSLSPGTKVITFVGRLDVQKGVDILVEAIAALKVPGLDFKLWLVGEGILHPELMNQVQGLGLTGEVMFWGYQDDIPLFLKASDIFVLPSRFEGMSIALLNGMAAGLPSVVARVGDNPVLVTDGMHGLVVTPGDVGELSNALLTLMTDQALCRRMAEAAQKQVQPYTDVLMVRSLEGVYNECSEA